MLAPMEPELAPLVRQLGLVADGAIYRGRAGHLDVVALLTTIGMPAARRATERILDRGVDHVIVVGIAGGVDRTAVQVGDVIVPEEVLDRASGRRYRPSANGDLVPRGTLSCGDELISDPRRIAAMAAEGVVAVDMETAAVAEVCAAAGCPWSVYRGISDYADEGLVDDDLFAMTRPDGTADHAAVARYLEENPGRTEDLEHLARITARTTEAAAAAAVRSCARL